MRGKGVILWLTGLSGAGKTTIARGVERELQARNCLVEVLDGDEIRTNISKELGFSKEDRETNIRRIGFIANRLSRNGIAVIVAAISPYRTIRDEVRMMSENFIEVYVDAPLEVCEARDVKGLYAKARSGKIRNFTGIEDPYEAPKNPEIICCTTKESIEECIDKIIAELDRRDYIYNSYKTNQSIEDIVSQTLNISKSAIRDDLEYQSIAEWDSLNHIALMLAIEKAYNTEISEDTMLNLTSITAIREYALQQQLSLSVSENQSLIDKEIEKLNTNIVKDKSENNHKVNIQQVVIHRGLNGVVYDNTRTTLIDGKSGKLLHCGYSIHELAEHSNFEEMTYLLINKKLPTSTDLEVFNKQLKEARYIPEQVVEVIRLIQNSHPMDVLRTAVSALSSFEQERENNKVEKTLSQGIRLIAQVPIIVATHHAIRTGRVPTPPSKTLSHVANFLYMLHDQTPLEQEVKILDRDFILHADHGSNASAFTARIATGTQADLHAAITAAIATFSGSLHGGAVESVMKMLQDIGQPEFAAEYIRKLQKENLPVYGFGHRVYRTEDPRAFHLREAAKYLSFERGETKWYRILEAIVDEMSSYINHGVDVNVDLYNCVTYYLLGIPYDLFVPVFAISRISGWITQVLEQLENNILIRPVLNYVGENERPYIPISDR
jgi:citrate synthase